MDSLCAKHRSRNLEFSPRIEFVEAWEKGCGVRGGWRRDVGRQVFCARSRSAVRSMVQRALSSLLPSTTSESDSYFCTSPRLDSISYGGDRVFVEAISGDVAQLRDCGFYALELAERLNRRPSKAVTVPHSAAYHVLPDKCVLNSSSSHAHARRL